MDMDVFSQGQKRWSKKLPLRLPSFQQAVSGLNFDILLMEYLGGHHGPHRCLPWMLKDSPCTVIVGDCLVWVLGGTKKMPITMGIIDFPFIVGALQMCLKGAPGVLKGHVWFLENRQVTRGVSPSRDGLTHGRHGSFCFFFRPPLTNQKSTRDLAPGPFSRKTFNKKIPNWQRVITVQMAFVRFQPLSAWKQFFQKLPKKLRQKLCFSGCVFAGLTPLSETQPWLINRDGSSKRNLWKNESRPQVEPGNGTGAMLEPRRSNRNLPKFTKI